MKAFLAFLYFSGGILVSFGLPWLMIQVAPLEYMPDRTAISNHNGRFEIPTAYFQTSPL
jgi:hypothetical protein